MNRTERGAFLVFCVCNPDHTFFLVQTNLSPELVQSLARSKTRPSSLPFVHPLLYVVLSSFSSVLRVATDGCLGIEHLRERAALGHALILRLL